MKRAKERITDKGTDNPRGDRQIKADVNHECEILYFFPYFLRLTNGAEEAGEMRENWGVYFKNEPTIPSSIRGEEMHAPVSLFF